MSHRSPVLRWLVRQVFRGAVIPVPGEAGAALWVRPAEYPSLLLGTRRVERRIAEEWAALLRPGEAILDIGANIGFTTQRFFRILNGRCRIWAFEPLPRNLELLRRNVRRFGDSVSVVECAVGERDGVCVVVDNRRHGGLSRLRSLDSSKPRDAAFWQDVEDIRVRMVSLDTFADERSGIRPSFIKLDVEGAGHWVLQGSRRVLRDHRPVISCSFHSDEEREGVVKILGEHAYRGGTLRAGRWTWCSLESSEGTFIHPTDRRMAC